MLNLLNRVNRNKIVCIFVTLLFSLLRQVAAQQGVYLAKCFNQMKERELDPEGPPRFRGTGRHRFRPFRYYTFIPLLGSKLPYIAT